MLITAIEHQDGRLECLYGWGAIDIARNNISNVVYHVLDSRQSNILKEGTIEQVNVILQNILDHGN